MTKASALDSHDDWHGREINDVLASLNTSVHGLASEEAATRLKRDGPNRLPEGVRRTAITRFLMQFHNLLIYVLLASAVVSSLLGHGVDGAVILGVVLANAIIGYIQEGRAEEALEAIRSMIDPRSSVLRDGRRMTVPAHDIVRGDVVLIEAGDRVPADLRLIRGKNLKIDEAILTGESMPADKRTEGVARDASLGDRASMAFSGTFVAAGQGAGVAVGTGTDTELGRISTMLHGVQTLKTPLIAQMDHFARQLTFVILGACVAAVLLRRVGAGVPAV